MKRLILSLLLLGMFSSSVALTHITFWHAMSGRTGEALNQLVQAFNASQTQYQVDAYYKGNYPETLTQLVAAFRAKSSPTMVQVFEVGTATMMTPKGIIKPVESLFSKKAASAFQAILPSIKTYYSDPKGQLLAYPFNVSTPVLYYNKRLFQQAGLNNVPQTWQAMFDALQQLKRKDVIGLSTSWPAWIFFENYTASAHIPFATDCNGFTSHSPKLIYDTPAFLTFLETVLQWQERGWYQYGGREDDALSLFTSEKVAMLIHSSGSIATLPDTVNFPMGVAPMPQVNKHHPGVLIGGGAIWVLNHHSQTEYAGASAFLAFLLDVDNQLKWQALTGYLPITRAAIKQANAKHFYKTHPSLWVPVSQLLEIRPKDSVGLRLGYHHLIRNINLDALELMLMKKQTPQSAVAFAIKRGDLVLKQFAGDAS